MMAKRKIFFDKKVLIIGMALLVFVGGFVGFSTAAYAAGEQVFISDANERNITVAASQSVFIAPNIALSGFGFNIQSAKVVIENLPGDATVSYTNVSGLSVSYDSEKMVYTILGTADASVYQTLFRSFKINSGTTLRNDIKFTFLVSGNNTAAMYYSETGHYYEYISSPQISWSSASAAASTRTYNGMKGYLVTITSSGENAFVVDKMAESGWIGASDPTADGIWSWATGPEAGTQFWNGYRPGTPVGGLYNNWQSGEPNRDTAAGNYAHIMLSFPGFVPGEWNDMPDSNTFVQGYVVEYGGMPGDAPEDLDETVTVNIGASVTYNANGATSGTAPTDNNSPYTSGSTVTVLTNSGTLAKAGFVFSGWNTQANGQGTHYDATGTDTFSIYSNVTLYAEWECSVAYNSNGATSGSVPTDNNSPYAPSSTVTVLSNSGTLAKTGYTFDGWNTQSDGQGTHYDATGTDTFYISSNVTLYAEWNFSVTYNSNGATSGAVPTDNNSPYAPSSTVTVLTNSGTLAKTGYTFDGWNTQSDGQGTHYDATGADTFDISANVTLYAQWGCSVTYNANGATSGAAPTDNNSPYASGSTVTVLTNSGTLAKTGFVFDGWNTQADGQGTHYDAAGTDTLDISSNVTLYAEWNCSVTYDVNGATSGAVPTDNNSPYDPSSTVTVLTNSGTLEKTGYIFDGWNTQADGQGTHYNEAGFDTLTLSTNITLYAEWARDTDYDGVSDDDEVSAGTSPNDPQDKPLKGTITVTVYQQDGSAAEGLKCVLYSTPEIATTDANGIAVFRDVYLAPHTLTLRNETEQLGTYSLNFTKGPANSTTIADSAATDSDGSVNTTVARNFLSLKLEIQLNESNFWEIREAGYTQSAISGFTGRVENPQTGDYRCYTNNIWMFVAALIIGAFIVTGVAVKKKAIQ